MSSSVEPAVYELVPMAHVRDVEASARFYGWLGFHVADTVRHADRTQWAWLTSGKAHLMLAAAGEPVNAPQQAILLYLYTQDLSALRTKLVNCGLSERAPDAGHGTCAPSTVFEITHPFYMPEGELRVTDPDGYGLLIGQCELKRT